MSILKKILLVLLLVFIAMQFIRPARNIGQVGQADIANRLMVPGSVEGILKTSCYDCHSNNTRYPWYANIQPMGWVLANHIKDGKDDLNFNEFGTYTKRRQLSKLKAIGSSVKEGTMPLPSYTLLHQDAILSKEEKTLVTDWATKTRDSLEAKN
ncbi:MAG: heme-binding domain-containing protein [Segetibacter sp.]|jgi:hypothetical protein|nr:heme-binding domain-containing protein [Segetibacter sp.]